MPEKKQIRRAIPPLSEISFERCFLSARIVLMITLWLNQLIVYNSGMVQVLLCRMINKKTAAVSYCPDNS